MDDLALYLLDLIQNSIAVKSPIIECSITEGDMMSIIIKDNGIGMTKETLEKAISPFYTTRSTRKIGLGLPYIKMLAEQTEGQFEIHSEYQVGTELKIILNYHHLDMPPIGNLGEMVYLVSTHQDIQEFIFTYKKSDQEYEFVLSEVKEILGPTINQYSMMVALSNMINKEIENIRGVS
ncbi:MAG: ATP-binding protein [Firmicutes bacterium]|nr:ATP-binding protein [Bacillota bacterium]